MIKKSIYFLILFSFIFSLEASVKNKKDLNCSVLENDINQQGKIVFVTGSCSAGKSSIAINLAQKLNARYFNFDEIVMPIILKNFIKKHYGKFLAFFINKIFMRNFFKSVDLLSEKKRYKFQLKFYADLQNGLADGPTLKMYREVKKASLLGQDVVVESPIFFLEGVNLLHCLKEFDNTNITYVLAYCPWDNLIERIQKRNSVKNKKNSRELDWVVGNYIPYFDISANYKNEKFLEYLQGNNVHKVISEYSNSKYKKRRMHLMKETQKIVMKSFPKNIGYYIYPTFNYNLIVNTKKNTPEQGAELVCNYIKKKP